MMGPSWKMARSLKVEVAEEETAGHLHSPRPAPRTRPFFSAWAGSFDFSRPMEFWSDC